jgi:predicted secreted protein
MNDADIPEKLRLRLADERHLVLPAHGSGGYRWHCQVEGNSVRARIDYEEAFETGKPSAPVRSVAQIVTIVAVQPGDAVVLLQERRSWETTAAATHQIDVQVRSSDDWKRG